MAKKRSKRKMPIAIPASLARTQLGSLLEQLKRRRRFTITKNGKAAGILLSPDDFDDIMEELDPAFQRSLEISAKEYRDGKTVTLAELVKRHVSKAG